MMSRLRFPVAFSLALIVAAGALTMPRSASAADATEMKFLKDVKELTSTPHRRSGLADGSLKAAAYIEARLRSIKGIESVMTQDVPVVQPINTQCELYVNGKQIIAKDGKQVLYAARPNATQASITPAEGLKGKTIYVRGGRAHEYGRNTAKGKIVLVDFDSNQYWRDAFAFGAIAVVFVGDDTKPAAHAWHHDTIPVLLPRFYISKADATKLGLLTGSADMTIKAACEWKQLSGKNVIAIIKGTKADSFDTDKRETVVFAASLDSLSEIPMLAPGARDAANCAILLQMAEDFAKNPPARDVILCFFDGQTMNNLGAREFYGTIFRDKTAAINANTKTLEDRKKMLQEELEFFQLAAKILRRGADKIRTIPQGADMSNAYKPTIRLLKHQAAKASGTIVEILRPLRIKIAMAQMRILDRHALLTKRIEKFNAKTEEDKKKLESMQNELTTVAGKFEDAKATIAKLTPKREQLELEDRTWNSIRRFLANKKLLKPDWNESFKNDPEAKRKLLIPLAINRYDSLMADTIDICNTRQAELKAKLVALDNGITIRNTIVRNRNILLHMSVNLGDMHKTWTLIHGDDSPNMRLDTEGKSCYTALFTTARQSANALSGSVTHFSKAATEKKYSSRLFAPGKFIDSGAAARLYAVPNLAAMTAMDTLPRQGQPADTLKALNIQAVISQGTEFIAFSREYLSRNLNAGQPSKIVASIDEAIWSGNKPSGPSVNSAAGGSALNTQPVTGAIIALSFGAAAPAVSETPPGTSSFIIRKTGATGFYDMPARYGELTRWLPLAVTFDAATEDGPSRGLVSQIISDDAKATAMKPGALAGITVTRVRPKCIVTYGSARPAIIKTLAMRDISTAEFPKKEFLLLEQTDIIGVFAPYNASGIKLFNKRGAVLLNNSKEFPNGTGISVIDPFEHPEALAITANDILTLNAARLTLLYDNKIDQPTLRELSSRASELNDPATHRKDGKADNRTHEERCGDQAASAEISRRVYNPLVGVLTDLVTAVVLLLLLAIPFSFALERLIIGTPHIYQQIGWFTAFFMATFGVLFLVNPAFRIASTPIIIFLAFAIILLSTLVIFIMLRKLQTEISKMRGLSSSVHSADVSRLSTMMAAVSMGISTMRRRPLRTFLTATTVVLLTFTILTFASFGSEWGIRRTYEGPMSDSSPRILVRKQLWGEIPRGKLDMLRGHFSRVAEVIPNYWVAPTAAEVATASTTGENTAMIVTDMNVSKIMKINAAIGLDSRHLQRQPNLKKQLTGKLELLDGNGIFLTHTQQIVLGLTHADIGKTLIYGGQTFVFAGTINDAMSGMTLIDGSEICPVDYQSSAGGSSTSIKQEDEEQEGANDMESAQFLRYNLDDVVVISPAMAERMIGKVRSISMYAKDPKDLSEIAGMATTVAMLPTYVGEKGGVFRLLFTSLSSASGASDLLVPVLLGGLIIFATMLGSVSDREREIYTFSSLGLAPAHVASLFFAEAAMYAVVGGMGGYLLGQSVARAMAWLGTVFEFSVPAMNYSSTNAIVTILIVMGTVLISTIYPAMKASRSANPGIQRSWQIPKPEGDLFDILFPFTVSQYDIIGVVSFLQEHFDNYSDASLGVFAASESHIFRQCDGEMLGFGSTVALAPFDLGVDQRFVLLSQPSDIDGINEIRILLHRLAGAHGDWRRSNRTFIDDLRKQLLIWRSLGDDVMDHYRQKTLDNWENFPIKDVNSDNIGELA